MRLPSNVCRAAAAALVVLGLAGTVAACGGGTPVGSCNDFGNQRDAQRAANTSDGDEDGVFCERLPCPCMWPDRGDDAAQPRATQATGDAAKRAQGGAPQQSQPVAAQIIDVIDGDTIDVRLASGRRQRVRLLGIDAPEKTTLRTGQRECGGTEAAAAAAALGRRWTAVVLRPDLTQDALDRYGRLLAYVQPQDAPDTTFQEEMLRQGWAKVFVFGRVPFGRVDAFRRAAREARAARAGVWARCGGDFRRSIG